MEYFLQYLLIVIFIVVSAGPKVASTLSNAIKNGTKATMLGILGISLGIFIIAVISDSILGVLLSTSAMAYRVVKLLGGLYFLFLAATIFSTPAINPENIEENNGEKSISYWLWFKEGFLVINTAPK